MCCSTEEGKRIGDAVAYRDGRTEGIREELERTGAVTFAEHYERTGIQFQRFNTAYQLVAHKREHPEELERAKTFLMVPDYLGYVLTGEIANEYTNASTTALVDARTRTWDGRAHRASGPAARNLPAHQRAGA